MFPPEMGSTVDARNLGKIFRINGLRAGAEAQINPILTSIDAQISISNAAHVGSRLWDVSPVRIARTKDPVMATQPSEMIMYNEIFCALAMLSGMILQRAKAMRNKSALTLNAADP